MLRNEDGKPTIGFGAEIIDDLDKSNVTDIGKMIALLRWIEERMGDEGLETVTIDTSFKMFYLKGSR